MTAYLMLTSMLILGGCFVLVALERTNAAVSARLRRLALFERLPVRVLRRERRFSR